MAGTLVTGDTSADRGGPLMLRYLAISTLLCAGAGAVSVAHADVFRWVDDHGGVHYSDQWVPGSEVIKSSQKPKGGSSGSTGQSSYSAPKTSSAPPSQDNATKSVKEDLAKVRDQQCKDAKDRYDKAIQARRIYKAPAAVDPKAPKDTDRPEDRQYLSEEEADAYRVKARQDVMDFCGNKP
jgi:Domain of unknown function (DUF4124)